MSLVELMIGSVLGLLVSAMVITMFTSVLGSNQQALSTIRLNQELRNAMDMMVHDIRRAGYWSGTTVADNPYASIAKGSVQNVQAGVFLRASPTNFITAGTGDCVVMGYQGDGDSEADRRLSVYYLDSGTIWSLWEAITSAAAAAGVDCSDTGARLTDEDTINISSLVFTPLPSAASYATESAKGIRITLTGNAISDPRIETTIENEVKIRNEL
jgi:type IV pilus assembly protein PilW